MPAWHPHGCGHATYLSIVDYSQTANRDLNIGGIIAFDGFQFVQILEGDESVVYPLFDRISVDRRNHGVVCFRQQSPDRRHFKDWSMRMASALDILALSARLADKSAAAMGV